MAEKIIKTSGRPVDVKDGFPKTNVLLWISVADNNDRVVGGAAIFGDDGKWYWVCNGEKDYECEYAVEKWEYLEDNEEEKTLIKH